MSAAPLVSICIPAYKRIDHLQRLLDSIVMQSMKDFEVIVTDDSPDEAVQILCDRYKAKLPVAYYRNTSPLGTPRNWNEAILKSGGTWIKLMHDDDWFAGPDSLRVFADAIVSNPEGSFIFSAYRNIYSDHKDEKVSLSGRFYRKRRYKDPSNLIAGNYIGPPSCVIYKRKGDVFFDPSLKWLVDIEFYMRYLSFSKPVYIPRPLVNIGIGETQVTKASFRNPSVEIPEHFYLLEKMGEGSLRNLLVYDAWWRLIRNLSVTEERQFRDAGYQGPVPDKIGRMVRFQSRLPHWVLHTGIFSKVFMTFHFIFS